MVRDEIPAGAGDRVQAGPQPLKRMPELTLGVEGHNKIDVESSILVQQFCAQCKRIKRWKSTLNVRASRSSE